MPQELKEATSVGVRSLVVEGNFLLLQLESLRVVGALCVQRWDKQNSSALKRFNLLLQ